MRFSLPRLRMPQLSLPRLRLPRLPGMFIFAWLFAALKGWVMGSRPKDNDSLVMYDRMLLWLTFGTAAIGYYGDLGVDAGRTAPGERSFPLRQA